MNRRMFFGLLAAEAAILTVLSLAGAALPQWFSSAMAFPLEQVCAVLSLMAGGGAAMRGAALALWLGLGLLPLALPLLRGARGRSLAMPCVMSAVLLPAMRLMMNPAALVPQGLSAEGLMPVLRALIGGCVWSAAVCWLALRLLGLFRSGGRERLLKYMRALLHALCALFVGAALLPGLGDLASSLSRDCGAADKLIAALSFCVGALPAVMNLVITQRAIPLLDKMLSGEDPSAAAHAVARTGCAALAAETVSVVALNALQLLLSPGLSDISISVSIPVVSLAFALAALLGARLIEENRRLSDDNRLII